MKHCNTCNKTKPLDAFVKSKAGRKGICKKCHSAKVRDYYQRNKESILEKKRNAPSEVKKKLAKKKRDRFHNSPEEREKNRLRCKEYYTKQEAANPGTGARKCKRYNEVNKEKLAAKRKENYVKNSELILKRNREYYIKNRETILSWNKEYALKNKKYIARRDKNYLKNTIPAFDLYEDRLTIDDSPEKQSSTGYLTVRCKMCEKRFIPTLPQVKYRLNSLRDGGHGENSFYCSQDCKDACPVFNFNPAHVSNKAEPLVNPRSCQSNHLKQLQCDKEEGTHCERCGDFATDIYLHHTHPVATMPKTAICSAGHILLCYNCHQQLHQECK